MIHDALRLMVNRLNREIVAVDEGNAVELGNIAQSEGNGEGTGGDSLPSALILTLVNLSEDDTMRNGPRHRIENGRIVYRNRPVNLYLYLLFSANFGKYDTALKQLSRLIEFFQAHSTFTFRDTNDLTEVSRSAEALAGFRLTVELQSLSFEQINYLWGTLGGKQLPAALYRARLLAIDAEEVDGEGAPIAEIHTNLRNTAP